MSLIHLATLIINPDIPKVSTGPEEFKKIMNIVFEIMGALAVLMIVIGGFRYIVSGTNPDSVSASKRMIIYSLVGLLVIAFAATIVNFVVDKL